MRWLSSYHRTPTPSRLPHFSSYFNFITPEFEYFWGVRVHLPPSTGGDRRIRCPTHPDVPAAGGLAANHHTTELNTTPSSPAATTAADDSTSKPVSDSAMEELLREIIAPSPSSPTTSLHFEVFSPDSKVTEIPPTTFSAAVMPGNALDGEDLRRLLSMIPDVQFDQEQFDFSPSLDLPLSGWDLAESVFWHVDSSLPFISSLYWPSSLRLFYLTLLFMLWVMVISHHQTLEDLPWISDHGADW
jgi:hypothetical protein